MKGKRIVKEKRMSKSKVRYPKKVKKGQITSKEIKSIGYLDSNGRLRDSAPIESVAGIGVSKGRYLRSKGIKTVGDFKGTLELEGISTEKVIITPKKEISDVKLDKRKAKKNAKKLRKMADALSSKIEEKRNPATKTQNWTPRRARIIASMKDDADRLEDIQSIMYALAELNETGKLPSSLENVDTKTEIQTLNSYDSFPKVRLHSNHVKDLNEYAKTKSEKENLAIINQAKRDKEGWLVELNHQQIMALDRLLLDMEKRYKKEKELVKSDKEERELNWFRSSTFAGEPKRRIKPYKRLAKLGITNEQEFNEIKDDFESVKKPPKRKTQEEMNQEKIEELEDKVRRYKISGFFPTPRPVANKVVNYADIESHHTVLEPSAGNGLLADVIAENTNRDKSKIDVIEYNYDLREILELKGYNVVGNDFLKFDKRQYDRIVMNPPFEKEQDIRHVYHAYKVLKPNGRLVAIMSAGVKHRSTGKAPEFRTWVKNNNGEIIDLPEGSFKSSFMPTGVNTVMVVIDKKEIKAIRGVRKDTVFFEYIPEENVEKMRGEWYAKTVKGTYFPTPFKTKREAVETAEKHQKAWQRYFADPKGYGITEAEIWYE